MSADEAFVPRCSRLFRERKRFSRATAPRFLPCLLHLEITSLLLAWRMDPAPEPS